jgi:hypothetical protein
VEAPSEKTVVRALNGQRSIIASTKQSLRWWSVVVPLDGRTAFTLYFLAVIPPYSVLRYLAVICAQSALCIMRVNIQADYFTMFIDNSAKLTKLKAKITRNSEERDTKEAKSIYKHLFYHFPLVFNTSQRRHVPC